MEDGFAPSVEFLLGSRRSIASDCDLDGEVALLQTRAGHRLVFRGGSYRLAVRDKIPEYAQRLVGQEGHEALIRQVVDDESDGSIFSDLPMDFHRRDATG